VNPSSPNGEGATTSRFQLPPPPTSGVGDASAPPVPPVPPVSSAPPAYPEFPGYAADPDGREYRPGSNGRAIAALCCGVLGFVPFASIAAIVLGIVALAQLRRVVQNGRGMAVAGIVLGSLWVAGAVALVVFAVTSTPDRDESGALVPGQTVQVSDLRLGDCFDGVPATDGTPMTDATSVACSEPHEGQLAALATLPAGPWPGLEAAALRAESTCSTAVPSGVRVEDRGRVQLIYLYPSSQASWRADRGVSCILVDPDGGHLTHSVLNPQ
jgi:hypothetical protein